MVESVPISPLRGRDRPRAAFRVTLASGRRVKLRRLRSAERAAELARMVEGLRGAGIPPVAALRDDWLAVEWLAGARLCNRPGDYNLRETRNPRVP